MPDSIHEHLTDLLAEPGGDAGVAPATEPGSAGAGQVAGVTGDVAEAEGGDTAVPSTPDPDAAYVLPDELTQDKRVREWQSSVSRKQDADAARIAELEGRLASMETPSPDDPIPDLDKKRAGLVDEFTSIGESLKASSGAERDGFVIKQWQLRRAIFDADVQKYSYIHGADPEAQAFLDAYERGQVTGPLDVERLALLVAKNGGVSTDRTTALDAREAAIKKREDAVTATLASERAKLRREMGLDNVPSSGPAAKVTPNDAARAELDDLVTSGDTGRIAMQKALKLKLQHGLSAQ